MEKLQICKGILESFESFIAQSGITAVGKRDKGKKLKGGLILEGQLKGQKALWQSCHWRCSQQESTVLNYKCERKKCYLYTGRGEVEIAITPSCALARTEIYLSILYLI